MTHNIVSSIFFPSKNLKIDSALQSLSYITILCMRKERSRASAPGEVEFNVITQSYHGKRILSKGIPHTTFTGVKQLQQCLPRNRPEQLSSSVHVVYCWSTLHGKIFLLNLRVPKYISLSYTVQCICILTIRGIAPLPSSPFCARVLGGFLPPSPAVELAVAAVSAEDLREELRLRAWLFGGRSESRGRISGCWAEGINKCCIS